MGWKVHRLLGFCFIYSLCDGKDWFAYFYINEGWICGHFCFKLYSLSSIKFICTTIHVHGWDVLVACWLRDWQTILRYVMFVGFTVNATKDNALKKKKTMMSSSNKKNAYLFWIRLCCHLNQRLLSGVLKWTIFQHFSNQYLFFLLLLS